MRMSLCFCLLCGLLLALFQVTNIGELMQRQQRSAAGSGIQSCPICTFPNECLSFEIMFFKKKCLWPHKMMVQVGSDPRTEIKAIYILMY